MSDRISDLQNKLLRSRLALETMADGASRLRTRLLDDVALRGSLERLEKASAPTGAPAAAGPGEDGGFISDAWEIALINEEGK